MKFLPRLVSRLLGVSLLSALGFAAEHDPLAFDPSAFTEKSVTVDGKTIRYRAYEGLLYVAHPVDPAYQTINIFVPIEYYQGKSINGYTAATAPIFFPNTVGGYMPGRAGSPGATGGPGGPPPGGFPPGPPPQGALAGGPAGGPPAGGPPPGGLPPQGKRTDTLAAALAHGYVVASPGARGRTLKDAAGAYTGKAPACIVDLKAAVRYLRHNAKLLPGDTAKIVSNGTSAGGALSALVGATGNAPDYEPYLAALGAAPEHDDVFAASCYCPITNLDHADAAYEWLFAGVNTYNGRSGPKTMTAEQIALSAPLKALFPAYLNGLQLHRPDGTRLTLAADGTGSFGDYVASFVLASAQGALDRGEDLSKLDWLTVKDGRAVAMDFARYAAAVTRMKATPAFDDVKLGTGENNLFGTAQVDNQHFTAFAVAHSTDGQCADAAVVRLLNPMDFIGAPAVSTAPHWRIRHGTADRDTSLAISVMLAMRLQNAGRDVDFALPWKVPHSGDYDLPELFAWIDHLCR